MNICAQNKIFVHHNNHLCIIKPQCFVDKCSFVATSKLKVISCFHLGYTIFTPCNPKRTLAILVALIEPLSMTRF
jgi:hypothetical protein